MAGIQPSFGNIGILIGSLYPAFIVSFLFVASLFNFKLTGLVYLGGLTVTYIACWLVAMTGIVGERPPNAPLSCDLWAPSLNTKGPSFQAAISWFTFIYLLLPMLFNSVLNPIVVGLTAFFAIVNMLFQHMNNCSSFSGLLLGTVIGLVLGSAWYGIWSMSNPNLLFYNELVSNNAVCSRPSNETFKCSVYRGGELLGELT
tara:strand:+ start:173 stop:775 length:603 start_codon:yes stop_codon:yes gene_type:complete